MADHTHPRGVQTVLDEVERSASGQLSEYETLDTAELDTLDTTIAPPWTPPPPRKDVFQGTGEIIEGMRLCGLGAWSERSVKRMLAKRQIPAAKIRGQWVTTRSLLEGLADVWVRAQTQGMCLCRWCPQHGRL